MDLVQTRFNCCAINSNINYDTSLWRLQAYGQRDYPVPLTCCHLTNRNDYNSFLDPIPVNITTCESLQNDEYSNTRHTEVSHTGQPVYSYSLGMNKKKTLNFIGMPEQNRNMVSSTICRIFGHNTTVSHNGILHFAYNHFELYANISRNGYKRRCNDICAP